MLVYLNQEATHTLSFYFWTTCTSLERNEPWTTLQEVIRMDFLRSWANFTIVIIEMTLLKINSGLIGKIFISKNLYVTFHNFCGGFFIKNTLNNLEWWNNDSYLLINNAMISSVTHLMQRSFSDSSPFSLLLGSRLLASVMS